MVLTVVLRDTQTYANEHSHTNLHIHINTRFANTHIQQHTLSDIQTKTHIWTTLQRIRAHTHTHTQTHTHTRARARTHTNMHMHINAKIANRHIQKHTRADTYKKTNMGPTIQRIGPTHTHTHTRAHTQTCTCILINTHAQTHRQKETYTLQGTLTQTQAPDRSI